jgi:hypothetical protein
MNRWLRKKYLSITAKLKRSDDPELMSSKDKVRSYISTKQGTLTEEGGLDQLTYSYDNLLCNAGKKYFQADMSQSRLLSTRR